ncbi:hypothetical protein FVE85_2851 [Porphyridium purpureum]|uniref:Uncharacterized protein n=1 Tax=Porphyridium purpureum TaxID=35688 RepID=A0A5J4YUJ3_PORPP|nr:hypothetical protein FVE85_2851 [Porphyridium purpureum]|eukprot:POR2711..scf227_4
MQSGDVDEDRAAQLALLAGLTPAREPVVPFYEPSDSDGVTPERTQEIFAGTRTTSLVPRHDFVKTKPGWGLDENWQGTQEDMHALGEPSLAAALLTPHVVAQTHNAGEEMDSSSAGSGELKQNLLTPRFSLETGMIRAFTAGYIDVTSELDLGEKVFENVTPPQYTSQHMTTDGTLTVPESTARSDWGYDPDTRSLFAHTEALSSRSSEVTRTLWTFREASSSSVTSTSALHEAGTCGPHTVLSRENNHNLYGTGADTLESAICSPQQADIETAPSDHRGGRSNAGTEQQDGDEITAWADVIKADEVAEVRTKLEQMLRTITELQNDAASNLEKVTEASQLLSGIGRALESPVALWEGYDSVVSTWKISSVEDKLEALRVAHECLLNESRDLVQGLSSVDIFSDCSLARIRCLEPVRTRLNLEPQQDEKRKNLKADLAPALSLVVWFGVGIYLLCSARVTAGQEDFD